MKLKILESGRYRVCVPFNGDEIPVLAFLKAQSAQHAGSVRGYKALFQRYAQHGREQLTAVVFHEASKEEKIWEFIKGRLRLYCFVDEDGCVVVLSHGIVKKRQKARAADIERACRLRSRYLAAKKDGNIEYE